MKRYRLHAPRRGAWHPEMGRCPVTRKRQFPTRAIARRAVRILGPQAGGGSLYRCDACGFYHVSHYPPNVARAIQYLLDSLRHDRKQRRSHP